MSRPAAFLDRDGILNALVPDPASGHPESPLRPADVHLMPGAAAAARRLGESGFALVGVSNQPAAAKGTLSVDELLAVQERVLELLAAEGVDFDGFRLCLHHPDGVVPELSGDCACRKPAPGMLLDAAAALDLDLAASWMVGDTDADVAAGVAAGCRTALAENPDSAHKRLGAGDPDLRGVDLSQVARLILAREGDC